MRSLKQHLRPMSVRVGSWDERYHDEPINAIFVVWGFEKGHAQSIEYGYCINPHWLNYCYGRPFDYRNKYANLTDMTTDEDILQYVYNPNCSVAEFREIVRTQGLANIHWYLIRVKLIRRIKRIPEYRRTATAWMQKYHHRGQISTYSENYEGIWSLFDLLNFA